MKTYQENVKLDSKLIEKKDLLISSFLPFFHKTIIQNRQNKKNELEKKEKLIEKQISILTQEVNNYINTIYNLLKTHNEEKIYEYSNKIKNYKNINNFKYSNNYMIDLNASLKMYESDFVDIDINEENQIMGETEFNIAEFDKILLKIDKESEEQALINIMIKPNKNFDKKKEFFYGNLFIKNKGQLFTGIFDRNIIHDGYFILGLSLKRIDLKKAIEDNNKFHWKIIIFHKKN